MKFTAMSSDWYTFSYGDVYLTSFVNVSYLPRYSTEHQQQHTVHPLAEVLVSYFSQPFVGRQVLLEGHGRVEERERRGHP